MILKIKKEVFKQVNNFLYIAPSNVVANEPLLISGKNKVFIAKFNANKATLMVRK